MMNLFTGNHFYGSLGIILSVIFIGLRSLECEKIVYGANGKVAFALKNGELSIRHLDNVKRNNVGYVWTETKVLNGEGKPHMLYDVRKENETCSCDKYGCECHLTNGRVLMRSSGPSDCVNLDVAFAGEVSVCHNYDATSHIYGGSEQAFQKWTFDEYVLDKYPMVTRAKDAQGVVEPLWVTSDGISYRADKNVPLFVTMNKKLNKFCFVAEYIAPYNLPQSPDTRAHVNFDRCQKGDPRAARNALFSTEASHERVWMPSAPPDKRMVYEPIWSTWSKYKAQINQQIVLDFAKTIKQNGFGRNSQLEIDDLWETCYGSLTIDEKQFPNMTNLVDELKALDYRVTIWAHPFINVDCEPFYSEAKEKEFFVTNAENSIVTTWWNGNGSYIDFTNWYAVQWYEGRLRRILQLTGIDSVKFDAGESSYAPPSPLYNHESGVVPDDYVRAYARFASEFGNMTEMRTGHGTQQYPMYMRMGDRESEWGMGREGVGLGLETLIPTLLFLNLAGYPFVMPDMIGGNAYNNKTADKELFIRWLQVTTFMPVLQFSIPPWDYDQETVAITLKYVDLHGNYSDVIYAAMEESVKSGAPVNAPLWWIDTTDETALEIDSEYLLGEDILVAPVLKKGATSRDIYLPAGEWREEAYTKHEVFPGRQWIRNYPADLHTLPYFTRITI